MASAAWTSPKIRLIAPTGRFRAVPHGERAKSEPWGEDESDIASTALTLHYPGPLPIQHLLHICGAREPLQSVRERGRGEAHEDEYSGSREEDTQTKKTGPT